ncbi:hypothetical protein D6D22_08774 [Aureobasidium pullulans]|uniref:Uncharacterized protein n=1 Tax=Aureobasidium pullulans TaxID=5580 RepID=A0A4S8X6G4_AURPU|nr:hypothetical protein D6D22_08774 [Aureobasidium pullulans]
MSLRSAVISKSVVLDVDRHGNISSVATTYSQRIVTSTNNLIASVLLRARTSSGTHGPGCRYEPGSPRNPFPGPGSQYRARHEAAVSVHTSPDALLNGALVASAERMHRIREELLTPSRPRQPDFGRGSTSRRRRRDEGSLSPFEDLVTPTRCSRAAPASGSARGSRSVRFGETPMEDQLAALRRRIEELICASYPSGSRIALEEPAAHLP